MRNIPLSEFNENIVTLLSKELALVSAIDGEHRNAMTASFGGVGFLFGKPVLYAFIKPEHYTYELIERSGQLSLSFLKREHRNALGFCGSRSGRDTDKIADAGLHALSLPDGTLSYGEARLVISARVLYAQRLEADKFTDIAVRDAAYNEKFGTSMHMMIVAEITGVYENDN